MQQMIDPRNQSVQDCLKGKTYYVDFYQREYVWGRDTVRTLLDDIFYTFELSYDEFKDAELTEELMEKYNWYYLNVFITNTVSGKVYIVDGQQRLTTLTLIACKLYHMVTDEDIKDTLKDCIYGKDKWKGSVYRIDNEKRKRVMDCILNQTQYPSADSLKNKTEETLIARYRDIEEYLNAKGLDADQRKLTTFATYFLDRLVMVELGISQYDTPMVFEVINDRGEALKPFEILKGKMLGSLDKNDTQAYADTWDQGMMLLRDKDKGREDSFFGDYFRSRFVFKSNPGLAQALMNTYHRYIFSNNEVAMTLGFRKSDPEHSRKIKRFIDEDLKYYTALYAKFFNSDGSNPYLTYIRDIFHFTGLYQIIMSACVVDDPQETEKLLALSYEYDRFFVLLTLNGVYDSNDFQGLSYELNKKVQGKELSDYRELFDEMICRVIKESKNLLNVSSLLDYQSFVNCGYVSTNKTALRYILARIEQYLCEGLGREMVKPVVYMSTNAGPKRGYQVEHILSFNDTNRSYFTDDEDFESNRHKLGGLLLLLGSSNLSSGNEEYDEKLKTYLSGPVWGMTLCNDFYHSNIELQTFNRKLKACCGMELYPIEKFDKDALNYRSELMYNLVKLIWDVR